MTTTHLGQSTRWPRAVIDGCAGPGGWDVAADALGIEPLGIEWDDAACATREAAGLRTLQGDVAALDPRAVLAEYFDATAVLWGLIFSPPCQAFSMAGKGAGRGALAAYVAAIARLLAGESMDDIRRELDEASGDERGHLVLEPLRWAMALRPRWIALEQVEPVLPLWEAMADALRTLGYQAWTGVLSAEQYGVPQTRKRAILLASLDGPVARPEPTHRRYVAPRRREVQEDSLFAAPEPERIVAPEEAHLLPWVSMAEALGWTEGEVGFPRRADGGVATDDGYRERDLRAVTEPSFVLTEKARSWIRFRANDRPNAAVRGVDEPAPTITGGHDHAERVWLRTGNFTAVARDADGGRSAAGSVPYEREVTEPAPTVDGQAGRWKLRAGTNENDAVRGGDEPAPTLRFGARLNTVAWEPPTEYDSRGQTDGRTGKPNRKRSVDEPAPTIAGESRNDSWTHDRPATTVAGDPRIAEPGWRGAPRDYDADGNYVGKRSMDNAVRVSIAEALVLQSFPPDYPVQGTKTKQFEQVGNAVPPMLALHVLSAVTGALITEREEAADAA